MAVQEGKTSFNGRQYYVVQMPATQALKIQLQLTKIMGAAIGELIPHLRKDSKSDSGERLGSMGAAISALFKHASEEEVLELIQKVVLTAKIDGKRIDSVDEAFQGEYLADVYKVFFWVLGVNFASFFGAGGVDGMWSKFKAIAEKEYAALNASESQPTPPQA